MKCDEARKWMSPYLDSELGQTKTFEIGEHLAQCDACAARFEAERRADDLMRDRLAPERIPAGLWGSLQNKLTVPARTIWFPRRVALAMAAMIAIVAVGVTMLRTDEVAHLPQIVGAFVSNAPDGVPFVRDQDRAASARRVNAVLRRDFGVELPVPKPEQIAPHFDFELVSATVRTDDHGRDYVEVRLNCCNEPVLLAFVRDSKNSLPEVFERQSKLDEVVLVDGTGYHVAYRTLNETTVVGASKHPLAGIIGSLKVVGT